MYNWNHSTSIVFILCVAYLILLDESGFLCRLTSWNGLRCLTTERVMYIYIYIYKHIYNWKQFFINNLAASKYNMWHREANKCNNK